MTYEIITLMRQLIFPPQAAFPVSPTCGSPADRIFIRDRLKPEAVGQNKLIEESLSGKISA
jgi:hypothetical protein